VEWLEYAPGELVMEEGANAGEIFFVVSGRLRVVAHASTEDARVLGEIGRGEAIGEIALLAGTSRTASVLAIGPSVLVRLPKVAFEELLADHPAISMRLAGLIIERLRRANAGPSPRGRPTSVALISSSPTIDVRAIAEELAASLDAPDREKVITDREFRQRFAPEIRHDALPEGAQFQFRVARWLDDAEASCAEYHRRNSRYRIHQLCEDGMYRCQTPRTGSAANHYGAS